MPDMTPTERLELASALLDGEATPDERALAEGDASVAAVVQQLAALRIALGEVPAAGPEQVERHIGAALAVAGGTAAVVPLAPSRRRVQRRWAPVLGIAAAAVLVAGVGLAVTRGGDGAVTSGEDATSVQAKTADPAAANDGGAAQTTAAAAAPLSADSAAADQADQEVTAAPGTTAAAAESATVAAAPPMELTAEEELPDAVEEALEEPVAPAATRSATPCPGQEGEWFMDALWQGVPAHVFLLPSVDDPQEAVVVDATTCQTMASAALTP